MIGPQPEVPKTLGQDIYELIQGILSEELVRFPDEGEIAAHLARQDVAESVREVFKKHRLWH